MKEVAREAGLAGASVANNENLLAHGDGQRQTRKSASQYDTLCCGAEE